MKLCGVFVYHVFFFYNMQKNFKPNFPIYVQSSLFSNLDQSLFRGIKRLLSLFPGELSKYCLEFSIA